MLSPHLYTTSATDLLNYSFGGDFDMIHPSSPVMEQNEGGGLVEVGTFAMECIACQWECTHFECEIHTPRCFSPYHTYLERTGGGGTDRDHDDLPDDRNQPIKTCASDKYSEAMTNTCCCAHR